MAASRRRSSEKTPGYGACVERGGRARGVATCGRRVREQLPHCLAPALGVLLAGVCGGPRQITLAGSEVTSLLQPDRAIVCPGTAQYPRNSEGDIAVLKDGRLFLAWTRFYGGSEDDAAAEVAGRLSEDKGATWGEPFVVQPNDAGKNVMSVSLLRAGNGDLLLFYLRKNSSSDLKVAVRRSSDEARTWGGETMVTPQAGYHVMNNARVIRLRSGRLLAPVAHSVECWSGREHYRSVCYLSDDDGLTWRRGTGEADVEKRGAMEPGLVELRDGRILMIIRTQLGTIHCSYSSDGGETWSTPEPSGIAAPEAPATITRIPSTGDLLLVWNSNVDMSAGHCGRRTPLTTAISRNEGQTWEHLRDLESDPQHTYAYTSVTFVDDLAILSYYYANSFADSLRLTRLPIPWLYGK